LAIGQAQHVHRPGEVHADELTVSREKDKIEARHGSCVEVVLQHEVADVAACLNTREMGPWNGSEGAYRRTQRVVEDAGLRRRPADSGERRSWWPVGVDDVEGVQRRPGEVPRRTAWIRRRRRRLPRVDRGRPAAAVPEGGPGVSGGVEVAAARWGGRHLVAEVEDAAARWWRGAAE
jgi:hypothetical protein